jgi:hypothetical protein
MRVQHKPEPGEISHDTHDSRDLLSAFSPYLSDDLYKEAMRLIDLHDHGSMELFGHYNEEWTEKLEEEMGCFLNEEVWPHMQEISPEGCWFGANIGDGASYGWWGPEEEEKEEQE